MHIHSPVTFALVAVLGMPKFKKLFGLLSLFAAGNDNETLGQHLLNKIITFFSLFVFLFAVALTLACGSVLVRTRCPMVPVPLSPRFLGLAMAAPSTYYLFQQTNTFQDEIYVTAFIFAGIGTFVIGLFQCHPMHLLQTSLAFGFKIMMTSCLGGKSSFGAQDTRACCDRTHGDPASARAIASGASNRVCATMHAATSANTPLAADWLCNLVSAFAFAVSPLLIFAAAVLSLDLLFASQWQSAGLKIKLVVWVIGISLWSVIVFGDLVFLTISTAIVAQLPKKRSTILHRGCSRCMVLNVAMSSMGSLALGAALTHFANLMVVCTFFVSWAGPKRPDPEHSIGLLVGGSALSPDAAALSRQTRSSHDSNCCLNCFACCESCFAWTKSMSRFGNEAYVLLALTGQDFVSSTRLTARITRYRRQTESLRELKTKAVFLALGLGTSFVALCASAGANLAGKTDQNELGKAHTPLTYAVIGALFAALTSISVLQSVQALAIAPVVTLMCFPEECLTCSQHGEAYWAIMLAWLEEDSNMTEGMKLPRALEKELKHRRAAVTCNVNRYL